MSNTDNCAAALYASMLTRCRVLVARCQAANLYCGASTNEELPQRLTIYTGLRTRDQHALAVP